MEPATRSATAARAEEEPERWERMMELQTGDAARRAERTVDVCVTMGEEGGQSSVTLRRSSEQQSARDMTLLLQHAERNSPVATSTSLLQIADCSTCTAAGTSESAATRVESGVATVSRAHDTNLNSRAEP
jgi:hypothetical protein